MEPTQNEFVNQEILVGFIDESLDELASVVGKLIELESHGYSEQAVQALFRVFHSIKGNAAYFGLFFIKELCHSIEQIMDGIRKHETPFSTNLIELLIEGANATTACFELIRNQGVTAIIPENLVVIKKRIVEYTSTDSVPPVTETVSFSLLEEIVKDLETIQVDYEQFPSIFEKYQSKHDAAQDIQSKQVTRSENDSDSTDPYLFLVELITAPADIPANDPRFFETLSRLNTLRVDLTDHRIVEKLNTISGIILAASTTVGMDSLIRDSIQEELVLIRSMIASNRAIDPRSNDPVVTTTSGKTMRISEDAVDKFLEFVGELVIVEDLYANLTARGKAGTIDRDRLVLELRKITETFGLLSRDLQKSIMEIRKVPINLLFSRMPKIVHEIALATGKKIRVEIIGDSLRVDKTILEKLESPLVHMVRNAADHGIENPSVRLSNGKDDEGVIRLVAEEISGVVYIKVTDDGAGLNIERLRAKAIEIGFIHEKDTFDQQKIIDVMFHSGVSTAEKITDISGRGVGMDVVKRNLEDAGGEILTTTRANEGTEFILKIPAVATTQIIPGFVVRTENERFILPLDSVEATISVRSVLIDSVNGKGHVLKFKNEVLSIARLDDSIEQSNRKFTVSDTDIVLILQHKLQRRAYVVTAVDGIRQVVKKQLELPENSMAAVTGAAIMGDGLVSLVLNMDHLFL